MYFQPAELESIAMSDPDLRRGSPPGPPDSPIEHLPTHQAAANNDTAELAKLIQQGSQTVGTESKETPLHAAAKKGATDTLKWLLENKTASPLERAGNGNSAAHYAAVYGHLKALMVGHRDLCIHVHVLLWCHISDGPIVLVFECDICTLRLML